MAADSAEDKMAAQMANEAQFFGFVPLSFIDRGEYRRFSLRSVPLFKFGAIML